MSKYEGLYTFDVDNHRYIPVGQSDGIVDCFNFNHHESTESRIEDPKARKIFREWADFYGAKQFQVDHHDNFDKGETTSIWSTDIPTEPEIELPGHIGKDSETYTIAELCGEEGE